MVYVELKPPVRAAFSVIVLVGERVDESLSLGVFSDGPEDAASRPVKLNVVASDEPRRRPRLHPWGGCKRGGWGGRLSLRQEKPYLRLVLQHDPDLVRPLRTGMC